MLDFTSSLYLGLRHDSASLASLGGWESFTTGVPAALAEAPEASRLARQLARLQGCERATLAPSTLHLFWDFFGWLSRRPIAVHMDDGTYATGRWGAERAAARGVPVQRFPHHDVRALEHQLARADPGRVPIVLADGFCPACGKPAPVAAYLECARARGGLLVLDDTQALGIFGSMPTPRMPYGRGGGGSLRFANTGGPGVALISSLAKGFGAPIAVLSGSTDLVRGFEDGSETRVHCSPPSNAALRVVEHALTLNDQHGEALRARLLGRVRQFRRRLAAASLSARGGLFPVQTLLPSPQLDVRALHEWLRDAGIKTVLHAGKAGHGALVGVVVTAGHTAEAIDRIGEALMERAEVRSRSTG